MIDLGAFSTHAPSPGEAPGDYEQDLKQVGRLIDDLQQHANRIVYLCGNHEFRIARYAARAAEGAAAYNLLAPEIVIPRGRDKRRFTMIPYAGAPDGKYPYYAVTPNLAAVHGWSYAVSAARRHIQMSMGRSLIYGHTHKCEFTSIQNIWGSGVVSAINPGCTCRLVPTYNAGRITEWSHAFCVIYISRRNPLDWTAYNVPITDGRCILPDGREVKA